MYLLPIDVEAYGRVDADRKRRRNSRADEMLIDSQCDDLLDTVILNVVHPGLDRAIGAHRDVLGAHPQRHRSVGLCGTTVDRHFEFSRKRRSLAVAKLRLHQVHGWRADKGSHEHITRTIVDFLRSANLYDAPLVKHP